uniref:BRO1 domain-containing protein n=1 Tax=Caenorhabditis tropicalis TaxID=1561998 RepID=A0A1I7U059_9PELO
MTSSSPEEIPITKVFLTTAHCKELVPVITDFNKLIEALESKLELLKKMEQSQKHYVQAMEDGKNADETNAQFADDENDIYPYTRGLASYYYNAYIQTTKLLADETINLNEKAQKAQLDICHLIFNLVGHDLNIADRAAVVTVLVSWRKQGFEEIKVKGVRNIQFHEFYLLSEMFIKNADIIFNEYSQSARKKTQLDKVLSFKQRNRLTKTALAACHFQKQLSRLVLEYARIAYEDVADYAHRRMEYQISVHISQLHTLDLDARMMIAAAFGANLSNKNLIPTYPTVDVNKEKKVGKAAVKIENEQKMQKVHDLDDGTHDNYTKLYVLTQNVVTAYNEYMAERQPVMELQEKETTKAKKVIKASTSKQ